MVSEKGKGTRKASKRPALRYFFINDQIHKKLRIIRGQDLIYAWNYPEHKRSVYNYSWVLRNMKPAYPTSKVAKLINRTVRSIQMYMAAGAIRTPQHTYALNEPQKVAMYMWREEDIMELHAYVAGLRHGQEDHSVPTPRELRALLNEEAILYVKQGDKYVPSFKAKEI